MAGGSSERIHSMDALRASTMLLVVPVHAAAILSVNGHSGAWATAVYWFVHVVRLPLFFAMSGFFLTLLLGRKGLGGTVRNRTVRIAGPLALGLITLVPAMVFAAKLTGTVLAPGQAAPSGSPFGFELSFLWYLLIVDAVAIALFLGAPRLLSAAGRRTWGLFARPFAGTLALVVPTVLALWFAPTWTVAPATGTFVPELPALAYYGLFFGFGATLCAHRDLIVAAGLGAWRWATCALVATAAAALLFTLHNSPAYGTQPAVHGVALLVYAVATWASLIGLVGLAHRYLDRPRPALRYLADSSYWTYLSHMPAVILLVALAGTTGIGTVPQFALVAVGATAFSLLTYSLLVRYTVVGRLLNGPRKRSPKRDPLSSPQPRRVARDAAALT